MKLREFQKELKKRGIDCCVLANLRNKDENIFYFLQKEVECCFLLIPSEGRPKLFVPCSEGWKTRPEGVVIKKGFSKMDFLKKHLRRARKIGINKSCLSLNAYMRLRKAKKARYADVSMIIYRLRETKTEEEIRKIRAACRITSRIMQTCIKQFRKFRTESDVAAFLRNQGYELSFKPIVASGKNSALPHHERLCKLKKGFCVIDFGVKYEGYCADMTRTVYLGKPSKKELEIYDLVANAQESAINSLKAGAAISGIDKLIKKCLGNNHKRMIHGFGHSVGIEIHDPYEHKDKKRLLANTVFTIEPGIYLKNKFGVRIEDTILVTKTGCEILTKATKKLVMIG